MGGSTLTTDTRSHGRTTAAVDRRRQNCAVCDEQASGTYFGARVCLPCKSFFIRSTKDGDPRFSCLVKGSCNVTHSNRLRCQHCRFQKCLTVGMCRKEKPEIVEPGEGQALCSVCQDIANGVHFGVPTCEGCKKFFRRALKESSTYFCKLERSCPMNPRSRNTCRFCRYQKCLKVGMSRTAIRMGRPKKTISHDSPRPYSYGPGQDVGPYSSKQPLYHSPVSAGRHRVRAFSARHLAAPHHTSPHLHHSEQYFARRPAIVEGLAVKTNSYSYGRSSVAVPLEEGCVYYEWDSISRATSTGQDRYDNNSGGSGNGSPRSSHQWSGSSSGESSDGQENLLDIEDDLTNILYGLNSYHSEYNHADNVTPRVASHAMQPLRNDVIKIEGGCSRHQCRYANNEGQKNMAYSYDPQRFPVKQEACIPGYETLCEQGQLSHGQIHSKGNDQLSSNLHSQMYNSLLLTYNLGPIEETISGNRENRNYYPLGSSDINVI